MMVRARGSCWHFGLFGFCGRGLCVVFSAGRVFAVDAKGSLTRESVEPFLNDQERHTRQRFCSRKVKTKVVSAQGLVGLP